MKFSTILALAAPAFVAAAPVADLISPAPQDGTSPDPSKVLIQNVVYGGSGCPQGSVGVSISDDRTTMTLIFDSYVASIGPGVAITESRKNCQINVGLHYPGGFQFSVFSADYRGFAGLDAGVSGVQQSIYYFSGQQAQCSVQSNFKGPMQQNYLLHDQAISTSAIWSPCGADAMLNSNSQVRLTSTNKNANGILTTDSIDAKFTQVLYLQWRQCQQ